MSSTKTERKISSWFWWILTALPLIILLLIYLTNFVNFIKEQGTIANMETILDSYVNEYAISDILYDIDSAFQNAVPDVLRDSIINVLNQLNIANPSIAVILYWGIAIQLYRILFDFACLLPRLARKYLNRGFGVND